MNLTTNKKHSWIIGCCAASVFVAAVTLFQPLRYALIYNFIPVSLIGLLCIIIFRKILRGSPGLSLFALVAVAACFHWYNIVNFGPSAEFDGKEYLSLARGFAAGQGLSGDAYRPPLYPTLVGLCMKVGDARGLWVVIFQHFLLLASIPGIYYLGRQLNFSKEASLIGSTFIAVNSLLMQCAGFIMTEIIFMALILASLAALKRMFDYPTIARASTAGFLFALAAYCRPLSFPLLFCGCAALVLKKRKPGLRAAIVALLVFFGATAPWCLRNFTATGHYAMSASFGIQAFTKATAFRLENPRGRFYKCIEAPLGNVLRDMGRYGYGAPEIPENDWQINRVPHALVDSLKRYHGYSFFAAGDAEGKAALEGFIGKPISYVSSVAHSFATLLFAHRELYPSVGAIMPIKSGRLPPFAARMLQGAVYVSGYLFLLFPVVAFARKNFSFSQWAPFGIVCMMYLLTAAIQIGFTRYSVPWEPFKILCAAYIIESFLSTITKSRLTA
jgi:hypothetical protein